MNYLGFRYEEDCRLGGGTVSFACTPALSETNIYGSSRLGYADLAETKSGKSTQSDFSYYIGKKKYELTNHLGNVTTVVSDRPIANTTDPYSLTVDYYTPNLISSQEYYPFGSLMPGRDSYSEGYRFGFNGQEKDDEIHGVTGSSLNFKYRMYDSRIGRFLGVDPLASKYPELSPYHFTGNNPIRFVDFDGQDFGIKVNHKEKTIVVVANVYTTSEKSYKQALKSAGLWNTKTATVDGYAVTFQINVQKPVSVTQEEVLRFKPSLVRKNGKIKKYKYQITRNKLASSKA
jgi:RHS repeat-associated protein